MDIEDNSTAYMTTIIIYSGNKMGLAQLLVSLQPQLHPDDDIYIVSPDESAKKIAMMYGSTRCYIFVEISQKKGRAAIKLGLESMKDNKQEGALIISDRCVISTTFVKNLKKAAAKPDFGMLVPQVSETKTMLDQNFKWFNPVTTNVVELDGESLLNDACIYIKENEIGDKDLGMNYLQDIHVGYFGNELVGVLQEYKDAS